MDNNTLKKFQTNSILIGFDLGSIIMICIFSKNMIQSIVFILILILIGTKILVNWNESYELLQIQTKETKICEVMINEFYSYAGGRGTGVSIFIFQILKDLPYSTNAFDELKMILSLLLIWNFAESKILNSFQMKLNIANLKE